MVIGQGRKEELVKINKYNPIFELPLMYPDEIWVPVTSQAIPNITDGYYVSTYGNVYSCKKGIGYKAQTLSKYGYLKCGLMNINGTYVNMPVHRLVMLMFCYYPGCESLQVNHKDGVKTNNWIGNLEWCTPRENVLHAINMGLWNQAKGEDCGGATITNEQADQIGYLLSLSQYTHQQIADMVGCSLYVVHNMYGGYTWKDVYEKYDLANVPPYKAKGPSDEELERMCQYMEQHAPHHKTLNSLFIALKCDLYGEPYDKYHEGTMLRGYFHGDYRKEITQKYHPVIGGADR